MGQIFKPLIGALLVIGTISVLLVFKLAGSESETPMETMNVKNEIPTRLCYADFGLNADADSRAVLVLHAFDPGPSGVASIEVTPVDSGQPTYINTFPSGAFTATSLEQVQRFFIPAGKAECYDIRLVGGENAQAHVTLELQ